MLNKAWLYPSWYMINYLQRPSWEELQRTHPTYDLLDYDKYGTRRVWGGVIVNPGIHDISDVLNLKIKGGEIMRCLPERFTNALGECNSIVVIEKFVEILWFRRNSSELTDTKHKAQMKMLAPLKKIRLGYDWDYEYHFIFFFYTVHVLILYIFSYFLYFILLSLFIYFPTFALYIFVLFCPFITSLDFSTSVLRVLKYMRIVNNKYCINLSLFPS